MPAPAKRSTQRARITAEDKAETRAILSFKAINRSQPTSKRTAKNAKTVNYAKQPRRPSCQYTHISLLNDCRRPVRPADVKLATRQRIELREAVAVVAASGRIAIVTI